jgi:prepilin-type N-terminal cleavage/methylation domain-containing protein
MSMIKRAKNKQSGFTLIEMVVTLVLVGIIAALAGMWIVSVTNGYIQARASAETAQKAQLALARLTKEFSAIQSVNSASGSQITFTRPDKNLSPVTATVALNGSLLQIGNNTLANNVSSFTLRYCNDNFPNPTCTSSWSTDSKVIEIELEFSVTEDINTTFTKRVTPRNL